MSAYGRLSTWQNSNTRLLFSGCKSVMFLALAECRYRQCSVAFLFVTPVPRTFQFAGQVVSTSHMRFQLGNTRPELT